MLCFSPQLLELQHAKKAWKRLNKKFRSKLEKSVIRITQRRCHNHHHHRHLDFHRHEQQFQMNLSTIFVDDLYPEPVFMQTQKTDEAKDSSSASNKSSVSKAFKNEKDLRGKCIGSEKSSCDINRAWEAIVCSSPHLKGVDERAEEFIGKFREEMKLQKEKSILDYQDMLARSA